MKRNPTPVILIALLMLVLFATPQWILAGPLAAVDDAQTVILLHMDGPEGSSTFSDESGKVWVPVGDPRITGFMARFNQSFELGNDRSLLSPDTEDVYFAYDDFTIDLWARFEKPASAQKESILFVQGQDLRNGMILRRNTTTWEFKVRSAGIDIVSMSADTPLSGVWTHLAVVREGDTFHLFENGRQVSLVTDADGLPNFAAPLYIGAVSNSMHGNLDEFRISRTARWTKDFVPPSKPYQAPTPTPSLTPTITLTPTLTSTPFNTPTPISIVITVPAIITLNNGNTNDNTNSGSTNGGGGNFQALTPMAWMNQSGVAVFSGLSCGGYYVRTRVYVDDNQDGMMSPAEGVTGLQIFFLDQTYARLGSGYSVEGKVDFCIPITHYGKTLLVDVPYLQLFGTLQVPDQPNQDLELWFPGDPPSLPLFLP